MFNCDSREVTSFSNLSSTEAKLYERTLVKAFELYDIALVLASARNVVHEEPFLFRMNMGLARLSYLSGVSRLTWSRTSGSSSA